MLEPGCLAQDNTNFFWDDTLNRLGIGTDAPTTVLDIVGANNSLRMRSGNASNYVSLNLGRTVSDFSLATVGVATSWSDFSPVG